MLCTALRIRGDDRRGALVAKVHEMEETVRIAPVEGLEAEFVDDQDVATESAVAGWIQICPCA
jgi:hypothetical protein